MNKLLLVLFFGLTPILALGEEGLFAPHQDSSLPNSRNTIGAVIRVRPLIKFDIRVFGSQEEKEIYEKIPGIKDKRFLAGGGSVWPTIATKAEIEVGCADPGISLRPGLIDICNVYRATCTSLPCHTETGFLKDSATGFFISKQGHFLANYHVARECIERLGRTGGSEVAQECPDLEIEVPEWIGDSLEPVYHKVAGKVMLLRNLSQAEWKPSGNDFALLKIEYVPKAFLAFDLVPIKSGKKVWAIGFPAVTRRPPDALRSVGYSDANNSLRVSYGKVTDVTSVSSFQADADGVHGNSGSPVVDENGKCIGIFRDGTPEANKLRATQFAGEVMIARISEAYRLLRLSNLP